MRDFQVTAEPSGRTKKKPAQPGLPFVIQKHAASHLHYDFRLGWNGVLKSWAVAKGPSFNSKDRRLAVQVEDHPIEYGGFEGIIPKGQYGGGTVMVWDQGTWTPQPGFEDVTAALRDGELKFVLDGSKMKGKWVLVRMSSKPGSKWGSSYKPNWLLIKEHDSFERGPAEPAITDEQPDSAVTGRSLEQIAAAEDHVWQSNKTAYLRDPSIKVPPGQPWHRQDAKLNSSKLKAEPKPVPGAAATKQALAKLPEESQPGFIAPQLAVETAAPPSGADWLFELKLDGYRVQARVADGKATLLTRKGLDWTHRMGAVAEALAKLPVQSATLDGEVVVLDAEGHSSFALLQASFQDNEAHPLAHNNGHPLTYFAFDLLHLNGHSTRSLGLRERKQLLADILPKDSGTLRLSEDIDGKEGGDGETIFRHACELHAEGIVSKRADAPYRSSRNADWLKSKCLHEQELIVLGYTLSTEGDDRIGALLLGYYEHGRLLYAGRTGTGFTQKLRRDLLQQLATLRIARPALETIPADARRGVQWVSPSLVAQVRFATWTADNLVRQAAFLGLREDKPADEVVREAPVPKPKAQAGKNGQPALKAAKSVSKPTSSDLKDVHLTHPDKVLDPQSGLTKRELAGYYLAIAPHLLPHIVDRPLSLVRCPEGAGKPCFYQKHVIKMLPPGIDSIAVPDKKTGTLEPYITLNRKTATPEVLAGFAQMGVLEIHPWGSYNSDLDHPDRLILDLDPDEAIPWPTLCAAASDVRKRLKTLGLDSFLKLTGGKGLHIVAPLQPTLSWEQLKSAAHTLVLAMERDNPALYLTKMSKSARKGKIYLDYLRNERGATAVAPFSPRARLGAHVSLPLPWSALKEPARPAFAVRDFATWHSRLRSDPWKTMLTLRQILKPAT